MSSIAFWKAHRAASSGRLTVMISIAIAITVGADRSADGAAQDADAHTIPNVGKLSWQTSGQTTFVGAMELAMAGLPQHADYATIMGGTGLAYRMRWYKPASGKPYTGVAPLAELGDDTEPISLIFGLRIRSVEAPAEKQPERDRISNELTAAIAKGRPVVCYVNPHLDGAVAYGFRDGGKTILVSDYYPETAAVVPFNKLGTHFWFVEPGDAKPLSPSVALLNSLKIAVKNGTRMDQPELGGGHLLYGAQAFSAWRDALAASGEGANGPHLTSQTNWWS